MPLDLSRIDAPALKRAAREYDEQGFLLLSGVDDVSHRMASELAGRIGADETTLDSMLDPEKAVVFPQEIRQRLSKVDTSRELAVWLLHRLEDLLGEMLGPFVHVSSDFHGQFKGGGALQVDHGGYKPETSFMEVHGGYLLHQDFAGATIPTSPSAMTLWVALNTCPDWNLRLYPASHRQGILCSEFLALDDPRLASLEKPVDIQAARGTGVVFNAMLLHGTSNPGPRRRVSCDIRFFPLCGFLPSEVHMLGDDPLRRLNERLSEETAATLRAPLLEDRIFLGGEIERETVPERSVLNWVSYLDGLAHGRRDEALPHLERLANQGFDPSAPATYAAKFHNRPVSSKTLGAVRDRLSSVTPHAPELAELDRLLTRLAN